MGNNVQKTSFAKGMVNYVQGEIANQLGQLGQALPVSVVAVDNAMVTVKFEVEGPITFPQVKVPQTISRYARPPTQVGDKGMVMAADTYLGGVSGLGGGVATYGQKMPNLSALVFVPLSNKAWPAVDADAYNITAPNGAVIQDDSGNSVITLTPSSITLAVGGNSIVIDASGVKIMGKDFLTHKHTGVTPGGGTTGNVS